MSDFAEALGFGIGTFILVSFLIWGWKKANQIAKNPSKGIPLFYLLVVVFLSVAALPILGLQNIMPPILYIIIGALAAWCLYDSVTGLSKRRN